MEFFQRHHTQTRNITYVLLVRKNLSVMEQNSLIHYRFDRIPSFIYRVCRCCRSWTQTSTCHKWKIMGIPCSNVNVAMKLRSLDQYYFCEGWYLTSMYQKTCSVVFHATHDRKQWKHRPNEIIFPLPTSKQPGWPKKNTIRVEDCNRKRRVVISL